MPTWGGLDGPRLLSSLRRLCQNVLSRLQVGFRLWGPRANSMSLGWASQHVGDSWVLGTGTVRLPKARELRIRAQRVVKQANERPSLCKGVTLENQAWLESGFRASLPHAFETRLAALLRTVIVLFLGMNLLPKPVARCRLENLAWPKFVPEPSQIIFRASRIACGTSLRRISNLHYARLQSLA